MRAQYGIKQLFNLGDQRLIIGAERAANRTYCKETCSSDWLLAEKYYISIMYRDEAVLLLSPSVGTDN